MYYLNTGHYIQYIPIHMNTYDVPQGRATMCTIYANTYKYRPLHTIHTNTYPYKQYMPIHIDTCQYRLTPINMHNTYNMYNTYKT